MKYLAIFMCTFLGLPALVFGQGGDPEVWIDYTQTYYRVPVAQDGVYRILKSDLKNAGMPTETILNDNYQLFENGTEIPINVTATYIEFYGKSPRGDLDEELYEKLENQTAPGYSQYVDTAYYYLMAGAKKGLRYKPYSNTNVNGLSKVASHNKEHFFYYKEVYQLGQREYVTLFLPDLGAGDGWYSNNIDGGYYAGGSPDLTDLPSGISAHFKATVVGTNSRIADALNHDGYNQNVWVEYNSGGWKTLGIEYFFGYERKDLDFTFDNSYLNNGKFEFKVEHNRNYQGNPKGFKGQFTLCQVNISYKANLRVCNGKSAIFDIDADNSDRNLEMTNFGGNSPHIYDLTNELFLDYLQNGSRLNCRLPASSKGSQIVVYNESEIMSVKPVRTKFKKINYQVGTNFLIISHKRFKTSVDAYANYKQSAPGGSFTTTVVYIDDLFRNYLYGYHHPVAIKNFLRSLIVDGKKPQNVMFIGKAVNLSYLRTPDGVIDYSKDLVPSIGSPCSDWYYGRYLTPTQFTSPFAIGRLSATQNIEIANYLDKLKAYNALTDNKWRKDVLHVSGGKSGTELIRFRNYMAQFGRLIEGPKPGANVYYFGKETGLEIDVNLTDEIIARANQGIGLFSYFGHAGANVTEVDLATPVRYNNANTPMVMMFGGCVLGGCYEDVNSLGEDFITAKTGAVAWVANSAFSFESMVFEYTMEFYREMAGTEYGKSIGELQRSTIEHYILEGNAYNESQCWNTQLQGDPSIVLYSPDKPDYEITNSNIFITPDNVTAQTDSFDFNLIIRNNGLAIADSLITTYKLTYPNGSVTSDTLRLFKVYNSDTFTFNFRNKSRLFGEYKVEVNLDPDNIVQEIRENNNSATYTFILVSNGSAGLYPPDYGIVSSSDVELVAQSLDLNAKNNDFQFELDTTPNFKSPWRKQSGNVRSNLVGSWKVNLLAKDSQDYYWRVRIKLKNGSYSPWTSKSFSYISNSLDGWAQLDFKQLKNSHLTNIYSDTSIRSFRFYRFTAPGQFIIQNHGRDYPPGQHYDFGTRITWVDEKLLRNNQYGLIDGNNSLNGMVVYAFNPNINENDLFDPWIKDFGVYQNKNGETRFDWMKTETEIDPVILDSFISYVNQVPKGYHVLMYSGYYHRIADMPERFYKAIESLGSSQIRKVKNNGVWLLAGTKGYAPGEAEDEQYTTQQDSLLQSSVSFTVIKSDGVYASSVIGPSKKWRLLQIASKDFKSNNAGVNNYYNLLGIDREGNKLVLVDNFKAQNLDLSFIDAEKYPYLQLELRTKNTNDFIPAKPQTWVVSYDYLPEGLINTQLAYKFDRDSVQQGELLNFEIGYQNVSKLSLENVVVTYEIQNNNRESKFFETDTIKPLGPGESTILRKTFNSNNLLNANKLIVKTNPNFKVPELYSFNNNFQHDFYVEGDFELPLMEVTFDGARILDGDIVSPEPEIVISGKDNNNYFLIDKPEYFEIYLLNNNTGTNQKIESTTDGFTFYPATVKNRTAKIRFNPARLADGKYSLSVQLSDASGNTSGKTAYTVNFEVVGASTITNFYPYPNPFSTEMKFVFTLTGSQIPDDIVIQIFTVSGKLVREITKGELGHLKIGQNVSTFAWNGTDMFGNRLANGVYLYRVKTVINGKQVEHRATSKDNAFKDSYGKIYILR